MSDHFEYICKLDPKWCAETVPSILWAFLIIALFLIIPYIYIRFIELRLIVLVQKIKLKIYFKFIGILQRVRPH